MKKVLFSLAILATVTLFSCSGGSDPKESAKTFLTALSKADYEAAKKVSTAATAKSLDMMSTFTAMIPDSIKKKKAENKIDIKDAKVTDNKAVVTFTESDKPGDQTLNMVKEDGKWKAEWTKDAGAGADAAAGAETPASKDEAMPIAADSTHKTDAKKTH